MAIEQHQKRIDELEKQLEDLTSALVKWKMGIEPWEAVARELIEIVWPEFVPEARAALMVERKRRNE